MTLLEVSSPGRSVLSLNPAEPTWLDLLLAQQPNACGEGAALETAEGKVLLGVDVRVHDGGIGVVGNVLETAAEGPIAAEGVEAFFYEQIQREVTWEAAGSR